MKKVLLAASVLFGLTAMGQDLPKPSPEGEVHQRVGLTDIVVKYSRPSVKEREIFGGLVPYNELWRTGANANTTIEFSTPVNFGGKMVEAGTYSIVTIPRENEWEIILNSKTDMWGTNAYSEEFDVARVTAATMEDSHTESFTIGIANIMPNGADLSFEWAEVMVNVPIEIEVDDLAMKNIAEALADEDNEKRWVVLRNAANYHYNSGQNLGTAEDYMRQSLELEPNNWYSHWLMARILAEQGNYKEAIKVADKAVEVGHEQAEENDSEFGYEEMIEEAIEDWKEAKKA